LRNIISKKTIKLGNVDKVNDIEDGGEICSSTNLGIHRADSYNDFIAIDNDIIRREFGSVDEFKNKIRNAKISIEVSQQITSGDIKIITDLIIKIEEVQNS
jgi:hypothetical protein